MEKCGALRTRTIIIIEKIHFLDFNGATLSALPVRITLGNI
jgi:hypothetical protein